MLKELLQEKADSITNRQKVTNALQRAGVKYDTSPDKLRIISDSTKTSKTHKLYGLGDKLPKNKIDDVLKELEKEYPKAKISGGFHITIKVPMKVQMNEEDRGSVEIPKETMDRILEALELAHDTMLRKDEVSEKTIEFMLNSLSKTLKLIDPHHEYKG